MKECVFETEGGYPAYCTLTAYGSASLSQCRTKCDKDKCPIWQTYLNSMKK